MMERNDISWNHGVQDDVFGTKVWLNRISGLEAHFRIVRSHIPDGPMHDWLIGQIDAALSECDMYYRDAKPSDSSESS